MDKQQLLGYFQDHYLSRQDVLFKLPLNISIDSFWQDLVNQRKARATMLPLYSATGQPYWFVTTDKMVKASERLCEEAMKHDSFFDPYRIPLSQSLTSALSQEAYFTSFVEGADYPIQAAVDFLQRGSEPENAYEQNIMNNYQAGSYLLSALSIPFDEGFVKELATTLTDGQDGYRTTDTPSIPAMDAEPFMVPPAHMLADRMGQFYAFLADVRVHPLIKAAVGQAYILATRPFQEANERLGRLISNAILLRYGYDFFLDISISAYIARESYRYFKAMREIIRSDNDGDLTYFVEYYLELLVRALDGTRMEEAERLQSQLESERKMALQPLKPTVQYTQPHSYNAEAVARVIDNAESSQDAEDGGDASQVEHSVENHRAVDNGIDGTAPDPPELPDGDASYRSSQSQAGSTQGDSKIAAQCAAGTNRKGAPGGKTVKTASSSGGTCPQLLGLTNELMGKIGKMLDANITPFNSSQWAQAVGCDAVVGRYECRELHLLGVADRTCRENVYYYTFRFSKADFLNACQTVSQMRIMEPVNAQQWNSVLSMLEQTGIECIYKAVSFIRDRAAKRNPMFFLTDICRWSCLLESQCMEAIHTLAERGIIILPAKKNMKHRIVMPSNVTKPDGELLQADVAHQDKVQKSTSVMDKLAEMRRSGSTMHKRIALVLSDLLDKGQRQFTTADWMAITGVSKSQARCDTQIALSLGLISSDQSTKIDRWVLFRIETELIDSIRWDEIALPHYRVLNSILRLYGTNPFTRAEIAKATGVEAENIVYNLRALKRFAILSMKRAGSNDYQYRLSVPVDEAIAELHARGFPQVALVG